MHTWWSTVPPCKQRTADMVKHRILILQKEGKEEKKKRKRKKRKKKEYI